MKTQNLVRKKPEGNARGAERERQMAVGEFKAKCLGVMAEVAKTGKPLLITKRGEPFVEVGPPRQAKKRKKRSFIGRLVGVMEIVGDPDDLVKPVFPLEDYDMLK
jgi:prevent-host-death family protein